MEVYQETVNFKREVGSIMLLTHQDFEDLYSSMFSVYQYVSDKLSRASSNAMYGFDICEFPEFNNSYRLSFDDWINGLKAIKSFLIFNSPENMTIHEFLSDKTKKLVLAYAIKTVNNQLSDISENECKAMEEYLRLKRDYIDINYENHSEEQHNFEIRFFEREKRFFDKVKSGLGY